MKNRLLFILSFSIFLFFSPHVFFPFNRSHHRITANEETGSQTRIVILGRGTPNADPDISGSSVAIIVNEVPYLVDFGPGLIRQACAACRLGIEALALPNLKRAFLTHFHSDHTAGFPDLILTPWIMGRNEPLKVFGPPGIRSMTYHILMAYKKGIKTRLEGPEPANDQGFKVFATEIKPGIIYEDGNVKVKAFPVKHGSQKEAFGFRFVTPDKTIVISGDTAPTDSLIENAMGCDVLIHEVYSVAWFKMLSPKWQKYHTSFHTSSLELAEIANKTKPGLLILYHQLLKGGSTEEGLLEEIRQIYKGKVVFGRELGVY